MSAVPNLKVKLFADGADLAGIKEMAGNPAIKDSRPSDAHAQGGRVRLQGVRRASPSGRGGRPISFEVFADEFGEMEKQAHEIASWGRNIYVKIPVTNTKRESAARSWNASVAPASRST